MIMSIAGCSEDEAQSAYTKHKDTVAAIESVMSFQESYKKPEYVRDPELVNKYQEMCVKARKVCDIINAGRTSASHSSKPPAVMDVSGALTAPLQQAAVEEPRLQ
jgi:hypothetical protein